MFPRSCCVIWSVLLVVVVIDGVVYVAILFVELSPNKEEEEEALTDADPADAAATDCILR